MTYLFVSVFALSLMVLLMPLLQKLALHIGAVDLPGGRKVHSVPVPRIGGVLIAFAILLSLLVFAPLARELRALMAGAMVIAGLGLTDDLMGVKAIYKFGLQWLVAVLFIAMSSSQYPPGLPLPAWLVLPAAAFFLVAVVNAVNLQDGLDGLAAGQVAISAVCMGIHILYSGEWILVLVLVATVSAVMGFLRVNTWPASIFMGDSGSYLLGFLLGGVFLLGVAAGALPWWSGIFYFALPIADTSQVIVGRLLAGQPLFQADRRHLHHRLLALGFHHEQVVYVEYLVAGMLGLIPLLLASPLRLRWFGLGLLAILLLVTVVWPREKVPRPAMPATWRRILLAGLLPALAVLIGIQLVDIGPITWKYGVLPIGLALAFAAWSQLRLRAEEPRMSITMALLAGAQLFVYHMHNPGGFPWAWGPARAHLLLWVATGLASVVILLLVMKDREVVGTPLELLIVFGTLALFFLPVELKGRFRTDVLALELLSFHATCRVFHRILPPALMARAPIYAALSLVALLLVGMARR